MIGQAQLDLGRADAARAALERALALAPKDPERVDEARQALARATAGRPK